MKTFLIALFVLTNSFLFAQDLIAINSTHFSEIPLLNETQWEKNLLADINYIDYTFTPTSKGTIADIDETWAELCFGISFGYRF